MTDELDGFIARHSDEDNWGVLLPAILDNLSFHSEADDPNKHSNTPNTSVNPLVNHPINPHLNIPINLLASAPINATINSTTPIMPHNTATSHSVADGNGDETHAPASVDPQRATHLSSNLDRYSLLSN
jgi:hypothetical protein